MVAASTDEVRVLSLVNKESDGELPALIPGLGDALGSMMTVGPDVEVKVPMPEKPRENLVMALFWTSKSRPAVRVTPPVTNVWLVDAEPAVSPPLMVAASTDEVRVLSLVNKERDGVPPALMPALGEAVGSMKIGRASCRERVFGLV